MADGKQRTFHMRLDDDERELLARRAYERNPENQSIQEEVRHEIFPPQSRNELAVLRAEHRRRGIPDTKFLHATKLREMGIKAKYGRRKPIVEPSLQKQRRKKPK